jgi:hypothetical protein
MKGETERKSTKCDRSDLETLSSPPVVPNTMDGENQPLVADEPVEFGKQPVEGHSLGKSEAVVLRGVYWIYLK